MPLFVIQIRCSFQRAAPAGMFLELDEGCWPRMLLVLLRTRFGAVAPEVVARVRSAEPTQLERWAPQILSATSASELVT